MEERYNDDPLISGEPIYYAHTLSSKLKELHVIPLSDLHYGNPLSSTPHFMATLRLLEKPSYYGLVNGDMMECVIKSSKGDIATQRETPQKQAKWLTKQLMPYKKKLLGMTMGNHEKRVYDAVSHDYCSDIAEALGIPYRPEGLILKISFGNNNKGVDGRPYVYWSYMTHGYGGARTKAAKAVKVERVSAWMPTMDFIIMSHDHVVNVAPEVCLETDPRTKAEVDNEGKETGFMVGKVVAHRKMLIKSNAHLKYGGYSEMLGFPPVDLSTPVIKLAGTGKPKVRVEV